MDNGEEKEGIEFDAYISSKDNWIDSSKLGWGGEANRGKVW